MSTATLNVWITNLGDPCTIANNPGLPMPWVVAVAHCDGRVLNWSEGRYRHHREDTWIPIAQHPGPGGAPGWWYDSIPTRDGHVEIEVPPGCYSVRGSMHTWFLLGILKGNWATDHAVVQACCGDDVCITLYASSFQPCLVTIFEFVIPLLMHNQAIGREQGIRAIEALKALHRPEELSAFEQAELDMLRRAFAQMGKEIPGQPKA